MSRLDVELRIRLRNELSGPAREVAGELAAVKRSAEELGRVRAGGDLGRGLQNAAGSADRLDRELRKVPAASGQAAAGVEQVGRQARALGDTAAGPAILADKLQGVGAAADRATRALREANAAASQMPTSAGGGGGAGGTTATGRRSGASGAAGGEASPEQAAGVPAILRITPTGIATAVGVETLRRGAAAGTERARDAEDFEAAMRKRADADGEALVRARNEVAELARTVPLSLRGIQDAYVEAAASGIPEDRRAGYVRMTAEAASAFDMEGKAAGRALAAMRGGGMSLDEIPVFLDLVNKLGDEGGLVREAEIVDMFGRAGAAARMQGVSSRDSAAIMAGVREGGMEPETVARWFDKFTELLGTATQQKEGFTDGLRRLGLTPEAVQAGMTRDGGATVEDVLRRIGQNPTVAREVLGPMFQGWSGETARAAGALENISRFRGITRDPSQFEGSLRRTMNIDAGTARGQAQMAQNAIDIAAARAADVTNDATRAVASRVIAVERAINQGEGGLVGAVGSTVSARAGQVAEVIGQAFDAWGNATRRVLFGLTPAEAAVRAAANEATANGRLAAASAGRGLTPEQLRALTTAEVENMLSRRLSLQRRQADPGLSASSRATVDRELQGLSDALKQVLTSGESEQVARAVMQRYAAGIDGGGEIAIEAARRLRKQIEEILGAPITIRPNLQMPGLPGTGTQPPAGEATPQRSGMNGTGGRQVVIQSAHFHGVQDLERLHAEANRRSRDVIGDALMDTA